MLSELCKELRNWFIRDETDMHFAEFTVSGGQLPLDFVQQGQYFRIVGSTYNDGVYQYPTFGLVDETFNGAVWAMAVPPDVLQLSDDIDTYAATDAAQPSPMLSESFEGYSYTKDSKSSSWRTAFADRLARWRKL